MKHFDQETWDAYKEKELPILLPLLAGEGIVLDEEPYMPGACAVPDTPKLTLLGTRTSDGKRVVVYTTSDPEMAKEFARDAHIREWIERHECLPFTVHLAEELLFGRRDTHTFMVTEYLHEEQSFSELSLEQSFFFVLRVLEGLEQVPSLSYRAAREAQKILDTYSAQRYVNTVQEYRRGVTRMLSEHTKAQEVLALAGAALLRERDVIERHSGTLLYHGAAPDNVRMCKGETHLLYPSLFRFGNRYESWAHFVDYAALHKPELELALTKYVRDNRGAEAADVLRLMRLYTLVEVIHTDAQARERVAQEKVADLDTRIDFWTAVLETQLASGSD